MKVSYLGPQIMGIFRFLFGKPNSSSNERNQNHVVSPQPQKPLDWRNSSAHLLLLTRFLTSQDPTTTAQPHWEKVLHELPHQAIDRWISEGMLVSPPIESQLNTFTVTQLKDLLRQHTLTVSGRKDQLIKRLLEVDPDGMARVASQRRVYECSPEARQLATQYRDQQKKDRAECDQRTLELIYRKDFRGACLEAAHFEARQVFPRGIGMDWTNYNPDRDIALLTYMFERKPKILNDLKESDWEPLRVAAAMMHLCGKLKTTELMPMGFVTLPRFDPYIANDTAARMILFHAGHCLDQKEYSSMAVKEVKISCADNSCSVCQELARHRYPLDKCPELPYEHCTCEVGCRCLTSPVL
jgi:SAP domain-containing protein